MYGRMDNSLNLLNAYKYGQPTENEMMGDCALSNDGRFLLGSFGTNHYKARTAGIKDMFG